METSIGHEIQARESHEGLGKSTDGLFARIKRSSAGRVLLILASLAGAGAASCGGEEEPGFCDTAVDPDLENSGENRVGVENVQFQNSPTDERSIVVTCDLKNVRCVPVVLDFWARMRLRNGLGRGERDPGSQHLGSHEVWGNGPVTVIVPKPSTDESGAFAFSGVDAVQVCTSSSRGDEGCSAWTAAPGDFPEAPAVE